MQQKRLEWIFGVPCNGFCQTPERLRIGLDAAFHNIKSEVCEYKSMLTFNPKDDDCLLHLLWRYQGKMDAFALTALEHLLTIAISDPTISKFFADLPPVTY